MVIGADVPVSKTGAPLGGNPMRRKGQKNRSPPAGNVDLLRVVFGASREEAPEEVSASRAMRHQSIPRDAAGKAGRDERMPQEGPLKGPRDQPSGTESRSFRSGRLSWCARIEERLGLRPDKLTNTGRSFARRRGAWQQCRALTFWESAERRFSDTLRCKANRERSRSAPNRASCGASLALLFANLVHAIQFAQHCMISLW
jgi:hypothetical protein